MNKADVVVVGAGIAGLVAARDLSAAGYSVRVLEARDRVGGRTMGRALTNGFIVEMGGQWVGPTQTEILALIEELGLRTAPTYETGISITRWNGELVRWPTEEGTFGLGEASLPEFDRLTGKLESMAETVPVEAPWNAPEANAFDRQTLDSWLRSNTDDDDVYALFVNIVEALFTAEPEKISLLHFLFYLKSNGMLERMVSFAGGNQAERIVGGSHLISERMAASLGEDVVQLNAPVWAIEQDSAGVTVRYDGGTCLAGHVIVAIPPTLTGRIRYRPILPPIRDKLSQQFPMGSVVKAQVAYDEPFWRLEGLSGFADSLDAPPFFTIDSSPQDASCGVLAALFVASGARMLEALSADERRQVVLEHLAGLHGPRAAQPIDYVDMVWSSEEYTRGCYGGHLAPGVWTQFGPAISEPIGLIHWAGTETSAISSGYMDGAARSGRRAAAEVFNTLSEAPVDEPVAAPRH